MHRFLRREDGSVAIEGLFGGLLLLGWFMVAYEFYDAFRMRALVGNATYTVGDLISRQKAAIGPDWVDGVKRIFDQVARSRSADRSWIRVTLISCPATSSDLRNCDGSAKRVRMDASHGTGGQPALTQTTLDARAGSIPVMAAGDSAVVVETSYNYFPVSGIGDRTIGFGGQEPTRIGLPSTLTFREFIVTRPRGPRITWNADG